MKKDTTVIAGTNLAIAHTGEIKCDGCEKTIADGKRRLTGIQSCCVRHYSSLCLECVERVHAICVKARCFD